jgi:hypothetical protein
MIRKTILATDHPVQDLDDVITDVTQLPCTIRDIEIILVSSESVFMFIYAWNLISLGSNGIATNWMGCVLLWRALRSKSFYSSIQKLLMPLNCSHKC